MSKIPVQDRAEAATGAEPASPARTAGGRRKIPRKISARSLENAALHYLARFSAPSAHLRRVLLRRVDRSIRVHGGDPEEGRRLVDELVARYRRAGLLDDAAYAEGKARSLRRRGASGSAIRRALRAKGLSATEAEAALAALARDSEQSASESELMAASRLAQRRRLGPFRPAAARAEQRNRDLAVLARAGFDYDVARQVIDAPTPEDLPTP